MKTLFRDLKVGDKFKLNPYEPWWSEKASDVDAFVDVSSQTYKRISVSEDAEVIKLSFKA
ncbi:MAG: hypothetical protein CMK92_06340 [Pseudomonas sp.]|nr:hypothetical protein [Pseudomonas sp.]|tara:strand:- start:10 stop:189 length:180 start_codon:yes stop_codon:yes gene_type:complete